MKYRLPLHHWMLYLALLGCAAMPSRAAEPPAEPILRREAGEHTTAISRIASDAEGRWLATASGDKTVRLWSLADGRLLSTLRPPIGPGNEGNLHAVAMAPDGSTVAVAGFTEFNNGVTTAAADGFSIFLFDRATGRLLRRISGLPQLILHLAYSPDGRWLAASMAGRHGVRVFSAADGRLLAEDRDYGNASFSVQFSNDGRMVTTSLDGNVRLYRFDGEHLSLLAKREFPDDKQTFAARFSPDGRRVAIGFGKSMAVEILDSDTLELVYEPNSSVTGPLDSLTSVGWSRDGAALYAAGDAERDNQIFIRRWAEGGRGAAQEWAVAEQTILDLLPLPGGQLAFASAGPEWGVVDAAGTRRIFHPSILADFRRISPGLKLSGDGAQVRFSDEKDGKSPAVFDTHRRAFLAAEPDDLVSPRIAAPGLIVKDWEHNYAPRLNRTRLALKTEEVSRSLAIWPSGDGFVLGTGSYLRAYDSQGNARWTQPAPGIAWAVNISSDGRWVVAAYADGTIRWHRASDGAEQLAFFPHADKKRWILWTPTGYYDASPGAEDLIGWHLNRGKDNAADFFPASRFRSQFFRPDVIAKVLEAGSESAAVNLANTDSGRKPQAQAIAQALPPVVEILSPKEGSTVASSNVTIRYNTRTPGDAPVTAIRARINGQAVTLPEARNLNIQSGDGAREVVLPIPPQNSEIQLFAENKNGVSTPAVLRVTWAGAKPPQKEEPQFKPKLYVLAVGVSKYTNADYNLELAAKDANDFASVLQKQKGRLYADVVVRLLTDGKATRDDVVDGLEWLKRQVTSRDVGMMFLAGHGMNDNTGKYYFMPHNANPEKLLRTGVPQTDIKDTLNSLAGKAVFFVDTCHSGNALGTAKTRALGGDINGFVNELSSAENGVVVFTAATGRQFSLEDPAWGNGAFTKAVVEGLSGKADFQKTGKITHKGLDYYVAERVKELTGGKQSPVSIAPQGVTDFPIAVAK